MSQTSGTAKFKGTCRKGRIVLIPCNWVKEGRCGEDSRPCKIFDVKKAKA